MQLRGIGVVIGLIHRGGGGGGFAHLVTLSPLSFSFSFYILFTNEEGFGYVDQTDPLLMATPTMWIQDPRVCNVHYHN